MIRKLLEKLRSLFDDGGASERMTKDRGEQQEEAEEMTPGHSDRAGQIGMFSLAGPTGRPVPVEPDP